MSDDCLGRVPLKKLKAAIESLEKHCPDGKEISVSFEFLIGSFFPEVLDNIKDKIRTSYTKGYIDATNELEEKKCIN